MCSWIQSEKQTHTEHWALKQMKESWSNKIGKTSLFWQKFWQSCGWTMNAVLRPSPIVLYSNIPQPVTILECSSYIPWNFSNFPTTFIKTLQIGKSIGFLPQPEALISAITSVCSRQTGNEILCHNYATILFLCSSPYISYFVNCVYPCS